MDHPLQIECLDVFVIKDDFDGFRICDMSRNRKGWTIALKHVNALTIGLVEAKPRVIRIDDQEKGPASIFNGLNPFGTEEIAEFEREFPFRQIEYLNTMIPRVGNVCAIVQN